MKKHLEVIRATDRVNKKVLQDEVNQRTHLAGYTDRDGQPMIPQIMISVPVGKTKLNIWPRDENGNLIGD